MIITAGKRLFVFFGGCSISYDEQIETQPNEESIELSEEDQKKAVLLSWANFVAGLNNNREVKDVSDLFSQPLPPSYYSPIYFKVHLPLSLQKAELFRNEKAHFVIEDFECVYNGDVLLISAICNTNEWPFGVFDVRDHVRRVFSSITKVKTIPPCLDSRPIIFVMKGEPKEDKSLGFSIEISKPVNSRTLLESLYFEIGDELGEYFEVCSLSNEIGDKVEEIESKTLRLATEMGNFTQNDWKHPFRRRDFISQRKKDMIGILKDVSENQSNMNSLKKSKKDFKEFQSDLIPDVVTTSDFEYYATPYSVLDVDSTVRIVEHARNELESYVLNRYSLISAILGAVLGSLITLIASHL